MAVNWPEAGGVSNVIDVEREPPFLSQPDGFTSLEGITIKSTELDRQIREANVFARLDNIVAGIAPSYQPGHGWVITRTLSALSDSERAYLPSDDYPEVEVMKFVVNFKTGEQGFFVNQKGVFDGLQVSVGSDGRTRIAGSYRDIGNAVNLVNSLEQRLALRAYLCQEAD